MTQTVEPGDVPQPAGGDRAVHVERAVLVGAVRVHRVRDRQHHRVAARRPRPRWPISPSPRKASSSSRSSTPRSGSRVMRVRSVGESVVGHLGARSAVEPAYAAAPLALDLAAQEVRRRPTAARTAPRGRTSPGSPRPGRWRRPGSASPARRPTRRAAGRPPTQAGHREPEPDRQRDPTVHVGHDLDHHRRRQAERDRLQARAPPRTCRAAGPLLDDRADGVLTDRLHAAEPRLRSIDRASPTVTTEPVTSTAARAERVAERRSPPPRARPPRRWRRPGAARPTPGPRRTPRAAISASSLGRHGARVEFWVQTTWARCGSNAAEQPLDVLVRHHADDPDQRGERERVLEGGRGRRGAVRVVRGVEQDRRTACARSRAGPAR